MAVKKCCIDKCNSCSTRKEDIGVTYHKFPKDGNLCDTWISVTHCKHTEVPSYVCSRHFCKNDFRIFKDCKYVLKPDAVPSIFPWKKSVKKVIKMEIEELPKQLETDKTSDDSLNSSKESDGENLEAIRKFINDQENEIKLKTKQQTENNLNTVDVVQNTEPTNKQAEVEVSIEAVVEKPDDETMAVASSVMDMILNESEAKLAKKKDGKALVKPSLSSGDKGNSMALSVGSKVEAKDYGEFWYPAEIVEVDYDEMEVLVHYDDVSKKHDEWINVSSPRLRPSTGAPIPEIPPADPPTEVAPVSATPVKEEPKLEEKGKVTFAVGERCLARWRDNRRFIATISEDLGDGKYEIIFDDGVRWKSNTSRLYKLKEPSRKNSLNIDTAVPAVTPIPSPDYGPGPSAAPTVATIPAFHTHLFDPTRDYLGSKSERREMKRKLNIKEIFNIGQKKKKVETPKVEKVEKPKIVKKPKVVKRTLQLVLEDIQLKTEIKKDIPDAVASIIGTVAKEEVSKELKQNTKEEVIEVEQKIKDEIEEPLIDVDTLDLASSDTLSAPETQDIKQEADSVPDEEVKLEKFEQPDVKQGEVIDRMKEVITKLEDGLNENKPEPLDTPKPEILDTPKLEVKEVMTKAPDTDTKPLVNEAETKGKPKKNLSKIKKGKKLRLLQEKKVKKQVEIVKSELEEMKKQVEEMKMQMLRRTEELAKRKGREMPASFLLPGEWCCKWMNGQPVGTVSEVAHEAKVDGKKVALTRRSVQVEDNRLPPGWTKHMVRRSVGHSAGKWDIVLVSPDHHRFHTRSDMRHYLESNPAMAEELKPYMTAIMDFSVHLKLSRRMGWFTTTPDGQQASPLPAGTLASTSPLVRNKKLSLNRSKTKLKDKKKRKLCIKLKVPRDNYRSNTAGPSNRPALESFSDTSSDMPALPVLEDGYVYVGSLKVQIIENLLRCPADGCFKNFRNDTLLKMHIKHYHRELRKMLGATPKVLDLAYARTRPTEMEMRQLKLEAQRNTIKVKLPKLPKRAAEAKAETKDVSAELHVDTPTTPNKLDGDKTPKPQDSPKLRTALTNKPVKRPKVLLPVRRPEPVVPDPVQEDVPFEESLPMEPLVDVPILEPLDFETAISTHTVTKPVLDLKGKGSKKRKTFASIAKKMTSEDEDGWFGNNSDMDTRSSYPRSGSPDSKSMDQKLVSSESNEDQKDANSYMYTETGERIKLVHMKREEIINCHCGFREEDGLMVQCELCLCWQHALCHNIQKESEVPEKYTCSICLNPRRGRRSQRFLHDQDRLYEGLLPGAKPCESLRRSHELSGNLLRIEDALHALRVKYHVATKKDHPKLYLWAKDWETGELSMTQEKLNSDYSDLNIMISNIGKENLPVKPEEMKDMPMDIKTPPSEEQEDRFSQRDSQMGSQTLLSGLLSSPGGASLDLPISTQELERLAKTVQEQEASHESVSAPQPEAAIENSACRERLLRHIQRCQALIDARLDSIEAQVAELESQDPSLEGDESAEFYPRTKQTVQMMMRDLDTMEELGAIT